MKFSKPQTLKEIAQLINCDFIGDEEFKVLGINEIHVVTKGDIVFVDHPKYYDKALNSAATIILINKKVDCPQGKSLLISDDPFRDFNKITNHNLLDTQCGLRFIHKKHYQSLCDLNETNFDYELAMLFELSKLNFKIINIEIDTVYFKQKYNTKFNKLFDTIYIIKVFLIYRFLKNKSQK